MLNGNGPFFVCAYVVFPFAYGLRPISDIGIAAVWKVFWFGTGRVLLILMAH